MRHCFGPFTAGGVSFRIHRGGGFWCSFSPDRLQLVRAPVPLSEVVTTQSVRAGGAVELSFAGDTAKEIVLALEDGSTSRWAARVTTTPGGSSALLVLTRLGNTLLGSLRVHATQLPGGRLGLQLNLRPTHSRPGAPVAAGQRAATVTMPEAGARFAVIASAGTALDLHAMSFRH
jgi:hypothetical protein